MNEKKDAEKKKVKAKVGPTVILTGLVLVIAIGFFILRSPQGRQELGDSLRSHFQANKESSTSTALGASASSSGAVKPSAQPQVDWSKGVRKVAVFTGHSGVVCIAFSHDGRYALTGSNDSTAKLWSVPGGECIRAFAGHKSAVFTVAFSPDGRYALTGSWDETAKLWSIPGKQCSN